MGLSPGARLGPFEILSAIGAGGMGEVYKARDSRLGRTVAIKVLPPARSDQDRRGRFAREARVISGLNHPNICTLHDIGEDSGTDYLVMEYLEGETLADCLRRGALPLDQALRIATEVAEALDKAHRQGIVHRDLKPSNVMLTRTGAKLLDFGLARLRKNIEAGADTAASKSTADLHTRSILFGTVPYMAPEQFRGKEADSRSDIFAFGCVLYEMVTGRPAFGGDQPMEVASAILKSQPAAVTTLNPKLPPALGRLLEVCLAKDPEERWQCARDLRAELEWIQQSLTTLPSSDVHPTLSVWMLAALSMVLAAALLAAIFWNASPSQTQIQLPVRFSIELSGDDSLGEYLGSSVAFSPDGRRVAYVANHGSERSIYVRSLDTLKSTPVTGTGAAAALSSLPMASGSGSSPTVS